MRFILAAALTTFLFTNPALAASVTISVDRSEQLMRVSVDGVHKYTWPVSTGRKYRWTRPGRFGVQSMKVFHRSTIYNNAPMPHSIFYDGNRAIHGTSDVKRLGTRASHGCIRLLKKNARALFALVRENRNSTRITVE